MQALGPGARQLLASFPRLPSTYQVVAAAADTPITSRAVSTERNPEAYRFALVILTPLFSLPAGSLSALGRTPRLRRSRFIGTPLCAGSNRHRLGVATDRVNSSPPRPAHASHRQPRERRVAAGARRELASYDVASRALHLSVHPNPRPQQSACPCRSVLLAVAAVI